MQAAFVKMHGCGNDFVVFDERGESLGLTPSRAAAIADRHTGVGCDQFIVLESPPSGGGADVFMRIRNPDGGEAGACGNATRCVADLLFRETGRRTAIIRTIAGDLLSERRADGFFAVDMGTPRLAWADIPLSAPAETLHLKLQADGVSDPAAASMGNPHATFFVADLSQIPIERIGPDLEHARIFPERANIGFAEIRSRENMRLRVWERGAGLTRACGSGACAAVVNAARRDFTGRRVAVAVDGGVLEIEWRADDHVLMTGPVATVFRGTLDLDDFPA